MTETIARAWAVTRRDGMVLGFTDHDRGLSFEGIEFRPDAGLSARAVVQGSGLSVDNTEAAGALSDSAITEIDLMAGRWDAADVRLWDVDWNDPGNRRLIFRGQLGEVTRSGAAFRAELRGLSEPLNRAQGRVYHPRCSAELGDGQCKFDLTRAGYSAEGLTALVKNDLVLPGGRREVELWAGFGIAPAIGDRVRLIAGCDKRGETCRLKFLNYLNFRGFPHLPSEDWLLTPKVNR